MNIIWPPEETFTYEAETPKIEKGIVINALPGGKPKKRTKTTREENR